MATAKKKPTPKPKVVAGKHRKIIWTLGYRPFIMGGNVNAPIAAVVDVTGPFDVGRGVKVYLAVSPLTGQVHIAESVTGALVGTSLDQVRMDVAQADVAVMKKQIEEAQERFEDAENIGAEQFWRMLARNKE